MTVTFDATDDAVVQCPYPRYRKMRDQAPVLELDGAPFGRAGERIFAVSRHEDVKRILHAPATFSSRFGTPAAKPSPELLARLREVIAEGWPNVPTMLTEDPPPTSASLPSVTSSSSSSTSPPRSMIDGRIQVAGSETTASLVADVLVRLANHPDEASLRCGSSYILRGLEHLGLDVTYR